MILWRHGVLGGQLYYKLMSRRELFFFWKILLTFGTVQSDRNAMCALIAWYDRINLLISEYFDEKVRKTIHAEFGYLTGSYANIKLQRCRCLFFNSDQRSTYSCSLKLSRTLCFPCNFLEKTRILPVVKVESPRAKERTLHRACEPWIPRSDWGVETWRRLSNLEVSSAPSWIVTCTVICSLHMYMITRYIYLCN